MSATAAPTMRERRIADLVEILGAKISKAKLDALADYIDQYDINTVDAVEVGGARAPVERFEVYGLVIGVDANGNASTVASRYGFSVA